MYPPCVEINKKIIPEIRKNIVKELKDRGMKENEIAKVLRISQGMVSKYYKDEIEGNDIIKNISKKIAEMILNEYDEIKINETLCSFCINYRSSLNFCSIHRIENCTMCSYMYNKNFYYYENEMKNSLLESINMLNELKCRDILPEVRSNLLFAKDNAETYLDVMAFPGRISCFKNKLIYYKEPEFGASKYLSDILLNFKKFGFKSLMNIKYNEKFLKKIESNKKFKYKIVKNIEFELKEFREPYDFIISKGGLWIEPEIYVFGKEPEEVVKKILEVCL
ncbi:MAG: thiamine-phosphate synthase family protein [Thermoplasmata archaeon]